MQQLTKKSSKVLALEKLAERIEKAKQSGKKVVLCHGVFDLLHVGHLRHFEQAKRLGDLLVVTITEDKHVNKGPHRPAFPEDLRAEALGALSVVDYVGVSRWPMAIDLIKLLKPSYYVKGQDYADASKDVTGGIDLEREAIESVGGEIAFTDDITFSSTALINRNIPQHSPETGDYLYSISKKYSNEEIVNYIDNIKNLKVLVVGEAIIDEYVYCEALGKSSKEPMLAIKRLSEERFAGGTLSVANNIANFSDNVGIISLIGDDGKHDEYLKKSLNDKIKPIFLKRKNSPTIVKRRYIENYYFQKLLAVYEINDAPLIESDDDSLCKVLEKEVPNYDIVIVVDFGHSMLTNRAARVVSDNSKFLALNTQSNAGSTGYQTIFKYNTADYVCITEGETRLEVRDKVSDLKEIIPRLLSEINGKRIVVTRGKKGSIGFDSKEGIVEAPALAGPVVDRMGAGDAYLSITSLLAVQNAPMEIMEFVGNAVGAQAVSTIGHRDSIAKPSLVKYIKSLLTF